MVLPEENVLRDSVLQLLNPMGTDLLQDPTFIRNIGILNTSTDKFKGSVHSTVADIIYSANDTEFQKFERESKREGFFFEVSAIDGISTESSKFFDGLKDSILLSIEQRAFISRQANESNSVLQSIKKSRDHIYSDFIAILGIFSALIFGLFGGVQCFFNFHIFNCKGIEYF
ncbi:hypothetical protein [Oenococcus sp.]|uniref:hypothetical protein n=1 Tax=Oenococcus sp. TaxID=1979414 RepID=UPI0039E94E17